MTDDKTFNNLRWQIKQYAETSQDKADEKIKKVVSSSLELHRAHNNLTQEELARRLNVTRLQIARWESGNHKPSKLVMELLKKEKIIPEGAL